VPAPSSHACAIALYTFFRSGGRHIASFHPPAREEKALPVAVQKSFFSHIQRMEHPRRDARSWRRGRTRRLEVSSGGLLSLWMEFHPIPLRTLGLGAPFSRICCETADRVGSQQHVAAHTGSKHGLVRLCEGVCPSNFAGEGAQVENILHLQEILDPTSCATVVGNLSHKTAAAPHPQSYFGSQNRHIGGCAPERQAWQGWQAARAHMLPAGGQMSLLAGAKRLHQQIIVGSAVTTTGQASTDMTCWHGICRHTTHKAPMDACICRVSSLSTPHFGSREFCPNFFKSFKKSYKILRVPFVGGTVICELCLASIFAGKRGRRILGWLVGWLVR
jgi:hypothetical protein